MCLVNGSVKKLWVHLGLWEGWRSALQKEVLSELLQRCGLTRESGRRRNGSSQACGEGPRYVELTLTCNSPGTPGAWEFGCHSSHWESTP